MGRGNLKLHSRAVNKRTNSVTIRLTDSDLNLLKQAAEKRWPGAPLSRAAIVLSMAKIGAESVLKKR